MASPPPRKKSPSSSSSRRRDRISELPDRVLGHVLSFLPTKEAGRAAILASRWRDIFCSVHTVSFEEVQGERTDDWYTYFCKAAELKSCSGVLLDCISSALLRRRRQFGTRAEGFTTIPLQSFHFAFDNWHSWDNVAVDQWLSDVLRRGGDEELHLDLRFFIGPICARRNDDDDDIRETSANKGRGYPLPRSLYSCTALRTLCLSYCRLNLPELVDMPFLETLRLTGIHDDDSSIQRLISSCPRLVDLTLEANSRLTKVSVLDKCLRRFALRCCHNIAKVMIDASELRSLEYTGSMPEESLMSLGGSPRLVSCTVGLFCRVTCGEERFIGFRRFLEKVSSSKHLHLQHRGLDDSGFFAMFPPFSNLTRLVLQGPIQSSDIVDAVRRILEQTPNLEVLSLYMEMDPDRRVETLGYPRFGEIDHDDDEEEEQDQSAVLDNLRVPGESSFSMPCLRHQVKEINMVNYRCEVQHRVLGSLLLRNALVLERMCVVFAKAQFALQAELKKEIESWLVTKPEKSFM